MIRIGHLTDIHIADWSGFGGRDWLTKRATGYLNHRWRRASHHRREIVEAAVRRLIEQAPDHVIISGDLTNTGMRGELEAAAQVLSPLRAATIPTTVIPGNHDRYVPEKGPLLFEEVLGELQRADACAEGGYPFVVRHEGLSLVHLDSTLPTFPFMAYGRLREAQLVALDGMLEEEAGQGQRLLVAIHHHPRPFRQRRVEWSRKLYGGDRLRAIVRRRGCDLVIHGHNHYQQVEKLRDSHTVLCGLAASSVGSSATPQKCGAIGLYEFSDAGLEVLRFSRYEREEQGWSPFIPVRTSDIPHERGAPLGRRDAVDTRRNTPHQGEEG